MFILMMIRGMFTAISKQFKVARNVILLISVDMMHYFNGREKSIKGIFHNNAMFKNVIILITAWMRRQIYFYIALFCNIKTFFKIGFSVCFTDFHFMLRRKPNAFPIRRVCFKPFFVGFNSFRNMFRALFSHRNILSYKHIIVNSMLVMFMISHAYAQPIPTIAVAEEDGSPRVYNPYEIKFPNSSVTDNADGTVSVTVEGLATALCTQGKINCIYDELGDCPDSSRCFVADADNFHVYVNSVLRQTWKTTATDYFLLADDGGGGFFLLLDDGVGGYKIIIE